MTIDAAKLRAAIAADKAASACAADGNDGGVAVILNTPGLAQCNAPVPITISGLFSMLTEPSIARLSTHPSVSAIRADIMRGDRDALAHWAAMLAARPNPADPNSVGTITAAERDALLAAVEATQPTKCTIAESIGDLGDVVTAADVSEALKAQRADDVVTAYLAITWPAVSEYVPDDLAAARGLTPAHVAASKARHEGTILGVDVALRDDALALVQTVDPALALVLSQEAIADAKIRAQAAADAAAAAAQAGV